MLLFTAGCVTLSNSEIPTIDLICKSLKEDQQLVTLFSENFVPVNCRSSLEGVWQFAYQVIFFYSRWNLYCYIPDNYYVLIVF